MVEVSLEKCATAKGLDLELDQASFKLKMVLDGTILYDVKRTLPYPVDGNKGSAKFDRKRRTLTLWLPCCREVPQEEEKDRQMRQTQPESVVKVMGGSEPEVIREHTTAFGQTEEGARRGAARDAFNRKIRDWRRRHLDKRRPTTTPASWKSARSHLECHTSTAVERQDQGEDLERV